MQRRDPVCSPPEQQKSNLFLQSGKGKTISSLFTGRNLRPVQSSCSRGFGRLNLILRLRWKLFECASTWALFVWPHSASQKGWKSKNCVVLYGSDAFSIYNILNGKSVQRSSGGRSSQYLWLSFFVCRLVKRLLVNGPYYAMHNTENSVLRRAGGRGIIILCTAYI